MKKTYKKPEIETIMVPASNCLKIASEDEKHPTGTIGGEDADGTGAKEKVTLWGDEDEFDDDEKYYY